MKLRRITTLLAFVVTAFLMISTLLVCRQLLLRNYATLERHDVTQHVNAIAAVVQSEMTNLDRTATDYAAWDQMYNYMKHPTPEFPKSELSADTVTNLDVHLLMLVDTAGNAVLVRPYGQGRQLGNNDLQSLRSMARMSAGSRGSRGDGLVELSAGPAVVALRPIVPTDGIGTPRGTLLLVRLIDDRLLLHWSAVATIPFWISGLPSAGLTGPPQTSAPAPATSRIDEISNDLLSVRSNLADLSGKPTFTVSFRYTREILQQGRKTMRALVISLGLLGLIFGGANLWLMDRFVVVRIQQLITLTDEIRGEAGLAARTPVWGDDEISQLSTQMNRMLEGLENSQRQLISTQEQLKFQATHDHLTGSFNRAAALEFLNRELFRSQRENTTVGVILFDIDHFKRINDRHGHSTGDAVLRELARVISAQVRNFDMFARYGGEEFLVIAPNCSFLEALQLAERLMRRVRELRIPVDGYALPITASAGVATASAPHTAESAIMLADRALYRAKTNGRNRVEIEIVASSEPVWPNLAQSAPASLNA